MQIYLINRILNSKLTALQFSVREFCVLLTNFSKANRIDPILTDT